MKLRYGFLLGAICGLLTLSTSGCASIRPETAGMLAFELGHATGKELASATDDAVGTVSDSLSAVLIDVVESEFRRGLSVGLGEGAE